jgi:hypothetical protein
MSELGDRTPASDRLAHAQVQKLIERLGDSQVINLDTSVRDLMGAAGEALGPDFGGKLSLHFVCCNEYGLVTQ